MRKWISALAIASLILVGTLVVYKEAFAITPFCWQCEDYCNSCDGFYSVLSCWWQLPWQYCEVECIGCNQGCNCGRTICIMDPPI
jgi:hypothetical protein